jgi:rubrerythrin
MNEIEQIAEVKFREIVEAAKSVSDSAWVFADAIVKEIGPIYLPVIGTPAEEYARAWRSDAERLESNRKSMAEYEKIKSITEELNRCGFNYTEETIRSLITLASSVKDEQREKVHFWFAVAEINHERDRRIHLSCTLSNIEASRLHQEEKQRQKQKNEEREERAQKKRRRYVEPELPAEVKISNTLSRINAILSVDDHSELDPLRKLVNELLNKHIPEYKR